ncbi:MAG TPA: hypothetical protein VMR62_04115, partial [Bryobacteraceae bacterium]|nr:hypothetical protein [Bryobacteraceae bacterium]
MSQTSQAAETRIDLQSATLAQLLPFSQQTRYASILYSGRSDLTATLRRLRDEGIPLPSGLARISHRLDPPARGGAVS